MPRKGHKPAPGYGHELIHLERPRAELCGDSIHRLCYDIFGVKPSEQSKLDQRISHICQWRYRRNGAVVVVRRWVCRGCAIGWARKHIWTMAKANGQKTLFTDAELKGAG
jgi:hypothetical protein